MGRNVPCCVHVTTHEHNSVFVVQKGLSSACSADMHHKALDSNDHRTCHAMTQHSFPIIMHRQWAPLPVGQGMAYLVHNRRNATRLYKPPNIAWLGEGKATFSPADNRFVLVDSLKEPMHLVVWDLTRNETLTLGARLSCFYPIPKI